LRTQALYAAYPHLLKLLFPANFLYGPLLYLFTRELTGTGKRPFHYLIHFIPFLAVALFLIPAYYLLDGSVKLNFYYGADSGGLANIFSILEYMLWIHGIGYTIFSLSEARTYQRVVRECFSGIDKINLKWLIRIILIILTIWIVSVCFSLLSIAFPLPSMGIPAVTGIAGILLIYMIAYLMIRQPDLFRYIALMEEVTHPEKEVPDKQNRKYKNIHLDDPVQKELFLRLIQLLEDKRLYLKQDLSVKELAALLGVPSAHLSMVINNQSEHNFCTLVNSFRIEEAKRLLESEEYRDKNILEVAYDSGFNSKSVFNTYFRKITETTPLRYKKSFENRYL